MTQLLMPALSPTMTSGKIAKWLVKPGEKYKSGKILAEIETDKAVMEFEATEPGEIKAILIEAPSGEVNVNTPIAELVGSATSTPAVTTAPTTNTPAPAVPTVTAPTQEVAVEQGDVFKGTDSVVNIKLYPQEATKLKTVREALREAMQEEMRADDKVFLIGEEVADYQGAYKVSQGLLEEFGAKRVVDTPITEYGFAGLGVGAAFYGLKPIVEFMTFNFSLQAIDHIINSAAKTLYMSGGQIKSSIVFRGPNGAAARVGAQHSQNFAPIYAGIPGLKVIAPFDASSAKALLKAAIQDPNPVVFLEHELLYNYSFEVPTRSDFVLPIGKAAVVKEGKDVTLVSYSFGMVHALRASHELAKMGISCEVIDLRTIRPLDIETIVNSVKKTNRCVVVDEGWSVCSIASEVATRVSEEAFDYLDAPVARVNGKDVPLPYADNLEKMALPTVQDVIQAVRQVTYK